MMRHSHPIAADLESFQQPALACPVCGFEYVHPVGLMCYPPGQPNGVLRVDAHGIHLNPIPVPSERGVVITLEFICESGHKFEYTLTFHKGQTFIAQVAPPQALPFEAQPRTIWRN